MKKPCQKINKLSLKVNIILNNEEFVELFLV